MRITRILFRIVPVGLLALATSARADSVFIGKRELHGEIAEETSEHVVLRTGSGRITIPRKEITRIVREGEGPTLLAEARALARMHDRKALELFDRAAAAFRKAGDAENAETAARERVALASKIEREPRVETKGDPEGAVSPFFLARDRDAVAALVKAREAGDRDAGAQAAAKLDELALAHLADLEPRWAVGCYALGEELDPSDAKRRFEAELAARRKACGAAVRAHDGALALAAIAPVVKERPAEPAVAYLEGRALETQGRTVDAAVAYRRALEGVAIPDAATAPADLLRELARTLLEGTAPREGSPGFGPSWTRVETAHFVVYHQLGDVYRSDEARAFEDAREKALVRLEVAEAELERAPRELLFLFRDEDAYTAGGGPAWAGDATIDLEDGPHHRFCTFPGRRLRDAAGIAHELGHVLLREGYPALVLPPWASEGAAARAEPDAARDQRRTEGAALVAANAFPALRELLGAKPGTDRAFSVEVGVAFDLLVETTGSVKRTLKLAARMARRGVEPALRDLGLAPEALDAQLRAALARPR